MSMPRTVGQHHGNLRPALIGAALEAIAEGRLPSLREVARRAGVSPAAVYHHFADKRGLLVAVADEGFRGLHRALTRPEGGPEARLRDMSASYVRFAVEHAAHYQVMFHPELEADPTAEPPRPPSALETSARDAFATLVQAMADVMTQASDAEVRRQAVVAWALAHGAVQLVLGGLSPQLDATLDGEGMAGAVGEAVVRLAQR
ncbi:MAG: TetR/AcrR family transcriptional regulator [Myxococcota bacterium]